MSKPATKVDEFTRRRETEYLYNCVALPINADGDFKCIPKLVEKLADEFWATLTHHSRVLAVRIDLHSKNEIMNNKAIVDLLRWLKQDLKRRYRMTNIGYFWVRELGKKKKLHWHLVLFVDGNILQNSWAITERIKYYWKQKEYGEVKVPQNCFTRVTRGDAQSFEEAFYRSSYLCKERSKTAGADRSFGSSHLSSRQTPKQ